MKVTIEPVTAPLRSTFASAAGATSQRQLLLLRLEDAAGHVGFGEAAPLEHYDGVRFDDCRAALEDCHGVLSASDGGDRLALLRECAQAAVLPQALAAVDLALWDLAGRRADAPVWRLIGAPEAVAVEVNQTIAAADRAGAAAEALTAREAGYGALKVKVGLGDDAARLATVRAAAGPEMTVRLDANGAWSVPEAAAALRALAPAGLELCEEPVHGLDALAELAEAVDVPLAMDETVVAPGALDRRVCTAACLKVSQCGGITGLIESARRARETGYEVYLASTLDGPLGIAAALHAAALLRPERPCGLATIRLFATPLELLTARRGRLAPPAGPGLGDGLVPWYRA